MTTITRTEPTSSRTETVALSITVTEDRAQIGDEITREIEANADEVAELRKAREELRSGVFSTQEDVDQD